MASTDSSSTALARPISEHATANATADLPLAVGPRIARKGAALKMTGRESQRPNRYPDAMRRFGGLLAEDATEVMRSGLGDLDQPVTPGA